MKKGAGIILYNHENKILLQHRTDDAPINPSTWGIFGGGIEKGETPLEAVKRECMEELCYELKDPLLIYEGKFDNGPFHVYFYVYTESYDPSRELELREGKDMGWFSFNEIKKLDMPLLIFKLLSKVREKIVFS